MAPAEEQNLQPLLETLEDAAASATERTDAFLSLANRLSGEEGKEFTAAVGKQFPRVCKLFKEHITSENSDLSNAALQALGFCVFNSKIASGISVTEIEELLTTLNCIATTNSDKNTCTRALWVIAKQCFPSAEVGKMVPSILSTLETVLHRGDVQSMVIEYEALNIVIRLLEQTPAQMGEEAGRWAKLIIPLVVHSAPRVRLRGATALEMGMPLLLQKQQEVATITEPLMSTKIISELQRLFSTKNETYVLKLWPLFVKLLGKTLHRSGSFINSLLQLEELGFRSGSPVVKKIAFIAWKSLIDNFALNLEILSSTKRLKLLMQPLCSIHVRTETLALTKMEVWWHLLVRLGPQLSVNFEQVCAPLIQNALSMDSSAIPQGTPSRGAANHSLNQLTPGPKSGSFPLGSPTTPRINLNSSCISSVALPSVQLLGLEMLLHFLLGPEVAAFASQNKLVLGLEPLQHPLITSPSFFCKHASTLMNAVQDGFIAVGKEASDAILQVIWKDMISLVKTTIEAGNKRDRQGLDVLPLLLQALKNIITADVLSANKALTLLENTIKGLPQKVLGSPAYQVANMDLLNGTPALFLIQLLFHNGLLEQCAKEERFFICLETLVSCVLSGPTSPLAFSESVLGVLNQIAKLLENKELLWRMWSIVVNPLTERINQTNEVNQGDALEHNFSAVHTALTLPVNHLYTVQEFPQPTMKSLLRTWSELYRAFARCAALVATTEENVCCEELCAKILTGLGEETLECLSTLDGIVQSLTVMVECINFSPYSTKYPAKAKAPQTPTDWSKKKREPLGNLTSFLKLLVKLIDSFHALASKAQTPETLNSSLVSVASNILGIITSSISHISMASIIRRLFESLTKPLTTFYEKTSKSGDVPKVYGSLNSKLEKLLVEILLCLQSRYSGAYDSELLDEISSLLCVIFLHKNKQIRNQAAQFWNATFAKTTVLIYPEELKPVLNQVKQKTPLLLPGFETVAVTEESTGPYSDANENSQLDTKISGMEVKSSGKRDSLMAQAEDVKDKGTPARSKQTKLKLDFSSPKKKTTERFLEEEKSVDFVFIPPETKQRVLTEHQKDVLRTKRVDIPTMYNNLDASQDTALFTQYTQSQEDSAEKPTGIGIATGTDKETKDGEAVSKEEKMDTDLICGNQVTESSAEEKLLIPAEDCTEMDCSQETGLNESTCKEPTEDVSIGENTSAGSNGSVSSDVVSGTPPQSGSRRQSFITLEKFDGSLSKSFSSSPLNTFPMTETVAVPESQEDMDIAEGTTELVEKHKENAGIWVKGSLKKSDSLSIRTEDWKDISACGESKSSDQKMQLEEAECIPDTQIIEPNVMLSERGVKQLERDNETQADIEFKENKPPEGVSLDQKSIDISVQNTPCNQKSLRRSSRRRLEITEPGNTDKEKNDQTKKDNRDDEKHVPKVTQTNEDSTQKRKPVSEKVDGQVSIVQNENELRENSVLSDLNKKEYLPEEETNKSGKCFPIDDGRPEVYDLQDSGSDKGIQEKNSLRPRYQTRRASLVLLPGIENSESDSSETKEDNAPKKRSLRGRPKSIDALKNGEQSQSPEPPPPHGVAGRGTLPTMNTEIVSSSEMDMEITVISQTSELNDKSKTYTSINEPSGLKDLNMTLFEKGASVGLCTTRVESTCTEPGVSEPALETVPYNKTFDVAKSTLEANQMESFMTEPMSGDFSTVTSDVFSNSENSIHQFECPHKRSKRLRKSKGCDCCEEHQPEKPFTELKSFEKDLKHNLIKKPQPMSISDEEASSVYEDSVFVGPCAVSTPLLSSEKPCFFKASVTDRKSIVDSEQENTVVPQKTSSEEAEEATPICITNETCKAPVPELMELDDKTCEPCPAAETVSKVPEEQCCTDLVTESEALVPFVQDEKVKEKGLVGDKVKVGVGKSEEINAPELTLNCDQNEICGRHFETNSSSRSVMREGLSATEVELGSAVLGNAIHGEQATEKIATSGEQAVVDISTSGEKAAVVAASGEKTALDIETSGERYELDIATFGEKGTVDIAISGEQAVVMDIVTSGEQAGEEMDNVGSPPKFKGFACTALVSFNGSPSEVQARCIWSPSASPSTSILKKGVKRPQEDESPSPVNKMRRVSFADPIYKEEIADDIDRRSPVVRCLSSSASSPTSRTLKISSNVQSKLITTPTKVFLSPGSRSLGLKSSKKCLITEMAKEFLPSPKESVYPALVNCTTPVDVILPQITSNMWARGLGQLIRAKNIKTVGDLSTLTASEIKTLPIRSPKISTVRKALRVFHEQQVKTRGFDEFVALEEADKQVNGLDDKAFSTDDEGLATALLEPATALADEKPSTDLMAQIDALAIQLTPEELSNYSGSSLFEMQQKLSGMTNCVIRHLQTRWTSPPHESST